MTNSRPFTASLLALLAALGLVLVTTTNVLADTVHVYDNAHVLNQSQVQSDAAPLPNPIDIYTAAFPGTASTFDQRAAGHITSPRLIVIAIDTLHKHLAIDGGKSVPLATSQYSSARDAFISSFRSNQDYTRATIAAIDSLKSSLGVGNGSVPGIPIPAGGIFSSLLGVVCCVGLILVVIVGVIFAARWLFRRRSGFAGPQGIPYQQPYNQGYPPPQQQPYNQGYPPPPNYGPGYNQGQGINPLVAGGLGAAGGGLLGYELGKEAGEHEEREREQDQGGDWGGGDFGGGASGDFGGGGDSGGGASGDFGGDGDSGGGSSGDF